jgi:acetyl esterase/lipase
LSRKLVNLTPPPLNLSFSSTRGRKTMTRQLGPIALAALVAFGCVMTGAEASEPMTLKDYMALDGSLPTAHIPYGPAPKQYVELFEPAGRGPFPVAVLIHGGCFYNRYEGMPQFRGMAAALAARGVAAWSVEERGIDPPGGGSPGTFQDINAALAALSRHAKTLRLDPRRVVVVGHSAGAYLALWTAGRANLPSASPLREPHPLAVREVVALGGMGDLRPDVASFQASCGLDLDRITGAPGPDRPNVYADTTPFELAPNGAHTVFINGAVDKIATPEASAAYAARLRKKGDRTEAIVVQGASHYDEPTVNSPAWPYVLPAILKAVGKVPSRAGQP